ncbi:hypothetical protein PF006_g32784 [Phytophthora fragariae]|uniref:Uncharacterized protein n=1 Tax=Phytophthora fragariae TaxID=53985 RepID=A0A6A3P9W3_9STRA|nr:hypothetical protein PF006_g32784 [Phytophthora fragariae]
MSSALGAAGAVRICSGNVSVSALVMMSVASSFCGSFANRTCFIVVLACERVIAIIRQGSS